MNNTLLKAMDILEYIAQSEKPVGVSQLSRELGYAKSSVFDVVTTLCSRNYLEIGDAQLHTYKLGLKAYQIGSRYVHGNNLFAHAHDLLVDIAGQTGHTAYLAVESNGFLVYLDKCEGKSPLHFSSSVGTSNYLQITGLGKAILAGYTDQKAEELTRDKFVMRTPNTITSFEQLRRELEEIRERGYAFDIGEDNELFRCVAAPVYNETGRTIAAISISMLYMHFEEEKEALIRLVTGTAMRISQKMGYLGTSPYPVRTD